MVVRIDAHPAPNGKGSSKMTDPDRSDSGWDSFERMLQAARAGDRDAMNQMIDECRNYLLLVANQEIETAIQAKLGASDLVQQSLADMPGHLPQFRGSSREEFLGWMRQILINELRDVRRRFRASGGRDVTREKSLIDSANNLRPVADVLPTPSTQAMQDEIAEGLQSAMAQLPANQQQIVQLRNWQQKSFVEIGEQLEMSPDAARKTWYRAIVKLKDILSTQFESMLDPDELLREPEDE